MTDAAEEVAAGTMIAGRFRVEALLGAGGMADVYRAIDAATGAPIALKLIRPAVGGRGVEVEDRVRQEGEILRALAHPAIVRIETFGRTEDGQLFIAMELLEGETLGELMRRGTLSPAELAPIVAGTCAGLAAAHEKNIVHRDLKPDNIFLTQVGGALQVKLLDFGIARLDDAAKKLTKTGEILGTPRYMAPELLSAERNLDGRTDTYALGVILFEALAGKPPYLAANPTDLIVAILHAKHPPLKSVCPNLPPAVEAVVARAMARAREARYTSAQDLAEAYLSAASANKTAAVAPRAGMGTAVLGSMGAAEGASGAAPGGLEPGTFSQLPQVSAARAKGSGAENPRRVDSSSRAFAKTTPASVSQLPSPSPKPPAEAGATRKQGSGKKLAPSADSTAGPHGTVVLSGDSADPSQTTFDDTNYQLPTTGGRMKLIIVGLLAGALSAGLAITALSLVGKGGADDARESTAPDAQTGGAGGAAEDGAADTEAEDQDRVDAALPEIDGEPPLGVEMPEASQGAEEREGAQEPARRPSMRRRAMTGAPRVAPVVPTKASGMARGRMDAPIDEAPAPLPISPVPAPVPPPTTASGPTAAELTRDARHALRDGDPGRCAELAGQAVRVGGGHAAVRLRGDCLLGAGDRAGALAAYERFCRGAPEHPSAAQVRSIVESMGGHCD